MNEPDVIPEDIEYLRELNGWLMLAMLKGIAMREKQKAYFKSRERDDLITARQLEAEFDKTAQQALQVGHKDPA